MTPAAPAELPTLSTRREAAAFLGISERHLDHWIKADKIAVVRLGRLVKIHRNELERIAQEGIDQCTATNLCDREAPRLVRVRRKVATL